MPSTTPRQQATDALHQLFLAQAIAEVEGSLFSDSDDDLSSDSSSLASSESDSSSDFDDSDLDDIEIPPLSEHILEVMASLHDKRYLQARVPINKSGAQLHLLLTDWKYNQPKIFRSFVRMTPKAFDKLVEAIQHHPVFKQDQMEVEKQVALWAGVGYGTVHNVTKRVILEACCEGNLRQSVLQWPSETEQEQAKQWVENNSCPAWRDGWLMVDGTLVPLYARPAFFGNTWFDRKSNYSMNVQLVTTPDLRIVDFAVGLPGSQHDASAWEETHLFKEHDKLLGKDDFVWADSAYPLRIWCQSPYKR
ncbi:hypothetical protein K435DRAFT_878449 [Dendrothele bispora CBS 962.96]|uniref:DDE Tnp4 domain-containing protein n=1 Tax=Dendrothele bispora (strain CBS 962.96) TaxID=1314807 RepID=A0A4S8KN32_DENBC|nr:hypothetical protein K435DRAFT_878449 [Dendrothele bispora CBS 962.96]